MAIKKIFIFFLLLLFLFSFSFACFGANYYIPTEEELYILSENAFFESSFNFDNDSITSMGLDYISFDQFNFPSPSFSQFILIYVTPEGNFFCYPVQFSQSSFYGIDIFLFGANLDLYDGILFTEPGCDLGLGFAYYDDSYFYPSLVRNKGSSIQSGYVALSYLPEEPITFIDSVKNSLSLVISGIGDMLLSFITPGHPLFTLMQLLVLGISITFLLLAVKIIRRFIWGD